MPEHDGLEQEMSRAIMRFCNAEYNSLARKVVYRLQRINASGIYGDDYPYRTLWDEYCHEVQDGPYDLLERAWDITMSGIIKEVIDGVPYHEATLLSIGASWDMSESFDGPISGPVPDMMGRALQRAVSVLAINRRLPTGK